MSKVVTRLTGLLFLGVIAGLVYLTVLIYQKTFTASVDVTLRADRIGNQLSAPADVKIRGLIVGTVRGVSSTGDGATIELALQPDKVALIPRDVQARLLPKTLFGEKFVNLVEPPNASAQHIRAGDVIPQDRSETALETEKVLGDLMPVLQALKPAQLSYTLNALAGALRDRGDRTGRNLVALDAYLAKINPEVPRIQRNIRGLADLADYYDKAAPDLLALLDNTSGIGRNLVQEKGQLADFLASTTSSVDVLDGVLRENERRLVQLAAVSTPGLQLFAAYSPQYPCLLAGLRASEPIISGSFGGRQPGLHITLEQTKANGPYVKGDEPRYLDSRPAYCDGLPRPKVPAPDAEFKDGYRDASRAGIGGASARTASPASFLTGSPYDPAGQRGLLAAVAAPVLGVPLDAVPDVVQMLFGPLARGTRVGLA